MNEHLRKVCSQCGKHLPRSSFGRRKKSRDGLNGCCRDCRRAQQRGYIDEGRLMVPCPPFKRWLLTLGDDPPTIAKRCDSRTDVIRRVLRLNSERVHIDTVDRAAMGAGVSIDAIYEEDECKT